MFDTRFFINTFDLKNDILAGHYTKGDADSLAARFLENLSDAPFVFNIETTNHCNMNCVMCQRTTDLQRPLAHMDMDIFDTIVDQIEPMPKDVFDRWQAFVDQNLRRGTAPSENNFYFDVVSRAVILHGFGEPLLDPLLPQRVERLTRKSIPSYFSCNPNNIRIDFIQDLFEAGAGYIKFAMDSLDDEQAKRIRGRKADFTKAYKLLGDVLELKRKMGAKTVIVMTMLDFFGDDSEKSEAGRFMALWEGKDVYAYVKSVDNRWLLGNKGEDERLKGRERSHYSKQYCEYPWTSMTILADGSVVPCTQDINGLWSFGNVTETPLREIWQNDKFVEFRQHQVFGNFSDDFMCHAKCDQNLATYFLE